eukprot:gene1959-2227_t
MDSEANDKIRMRFQGNVEHDSSQLKARRIKGEAKKAEARNDPVWSKLAALDERAYTSGNRSGCGVTPKALQHISEEAGAGCNNLSLLVTKVHKCDLKICTEQRALHKSMMTEQKVKG